MQETESIDEYILQHIDPENDYLKALYRDTHVKLLRPRMASGHLQGRMLKMFVEMIRPRQILEIGTYSGYSALCLAEGLQKGGMLHTFEINDEQEDFKQQSDGSFLISCNANLDKMLELLEINEEYEVSTVNGWVMHELGKVPEEGDTFQIGQWTVTVTKVEYRRAIEIRVALRETEQ